MTPSASREDGRPRLRADAARNRDQILAAARAAFRELGTAAPLDEIARRAGVNIATLYRRFPDRDALIRQVVVDGFTLVHRTVRRALEAAPRDPLAAIGEFLLTLVDEREMLVLPLIGGPVTDDPEAAALQREIVTVLEELLATARAQGVVRPDATAVDLIATGALSCRPLPHLPAEQASALAARHVRIFLDGLRPDGARPLPPPPTNEDLTVHLHPVKGTDRGSGPSAR
ncbi:TetR/AcrR family transcriptional regulator [Streptomyces sp. NBC_01571]|uniref:TetR/AcrR family transcriptional regulator n=1 Tax=unclassified Streptomyces TaxID=2593676 RepID=UPI00225B7E73|nr:TetR/AcrR family transcriptional regulator [Streptomyces sp. NBC_01571]MCX4572178.1 TetR/AcrR family transcriptional regulator [Streptomyces sp. NBC_01571]